MAVERGLVALLLGELGQAQRILEAGLLLALAVDGGRQRVALAHDRLGAFGIVPELRVLGERVQLVEAEEGVIPVKDASAGGRGRP